jgi:SAM-dependent methyltransferase
MKQCQNCSDLHPSEDLACPNCGAQPSVVDGFEAYAPELAHEGGGFDPDAFASLADAEASNFWFRARNRLVLWALGRYAPAFQRMLEVGCGTGFVLSGVAKRFPGVHLVGSEIFTNGLQFAAERLPAAQLVQMDARRIPYVEDFDVIGAFDVLEHIKEDELTLQQIHGALKPGGIMVVAVPQHRWLWGPADVAAHHERRYEPKELEKKAKEAGFTILRSTSFVSLLLPAMALSRWLQRRSEAAYDPAAEMQPNPIVNWVFERLLGVEILAIRCGLNLPVGGSRLVIARKAEGQAT